MRTLEEITQVIDNEFGGEGCCYDLFHDLAAHVAELKQTVALLSKAPACVPDCPSLLRDTDPTRAEVARELAKFLDDLATSDPYPENMEHAAKLLARGRDCGLLPDPLKQTMEVNDG
jgi:hypothetical protein